VKEGDLVMGDKGFWDCKVDFRQVGAILLMPARGEKGSQFTPQEEEEGRYVAKYRVHVERLNRRIKSYRMALNPSICVHLRECIWRILCAASNFRTPLCPEKLREGAAAFESLDGEGDFSAVAVVADDFDPSSCHDNASE